MKEFLSFLFASAATALVIPDPTVLENDPASHITSLNAGSVAYFASDFLKSILWTVEGHGEEEAHIIESSWMPGSNDGIPNRALNDFSAFIKPHLDEAGHGDTDLTIYELINQSEHSSIFAKLVSKFEDIVKKLNSSSTTSTVFVPTNKAFERFSHHPDVPDEYIKAFVEYHISPQLFPAKEVFSSRTIPTSLQQAELGPYPQRISTQLGLRGLTLNFLSKMVKPDIEAKNGVAHAIDHILIPPFLASDTLNFVSSQFSTFELGLFKTGLFEHINKTSTHTGATIFAPTNFAFRKLPPPVTGFLFSRWGENYLRALLKYHLVFDQTLYSDAYNKPKDEQSSLASTHVDLQTLLESCYLSIDISRINRFVKMKINGFTTVAAPDVIVKDGAIHIVNDVLIPPRKPSPTSYRNGLQDQSAPQSYSDEEEDISRLTVDELMTRLEPFVN